MNPFKLDLFGRTYLMTSYDESIIAWQGECIVCKAPFETISGYHVKRLVITCKEHRGTVRRARQGKILIPTRKPSRRYLGATLSEPHVELIAGQLEGMLKSGPMRLSEIADDFVTKGGLIRRQAEAAIYRLLRERWGTFVSTATDDGDTLVRLGRPTAKKVRS